jgi:hypothetical protein
MFHDLKRKWHDKRLGSAPASSEELLAFERQNSVRLPADLRGYFLEVNGMSDMDNEDFFEFLPLHELETWPRLNWKVRPIPPPDSDPDHLFIFCDYLQSSWAYAIRLGPSEADGGEVTTCGWIVDAVVANSFSEFIALYLSNNRILYPPSSISIDRRSSTIVSPS